MISSQVFNPTDIIKNLPQLPGVYRMQDMERQIIYVGKAKDLKKRVSSYFQKNITNLKTQHLVSQIRYIDITVTESETEALLLEINLIKKHRPKYNIYFRDDKSYPYLFISSKDDYPKLTLHRGSKRKTGNYYGPYPNGLAARETMSLLQKIFKLRSCEESFFRNRTRPCLQYQINRCSGPCVKLISKKDYRRDINNAEIFLTGKSHAIIDQLAQQMENFSAEQAYETAAILRDQILALQKIQQPQAISHDSKINADVFAIISQHAHASVALIFIREGQVMGNQHFNLKIPDNTTTVFAEFLPQFYLDVDKPHDVPSEIIVNNDFSDRDLVSAALTQAANHHVAIKASVRGIRAKWQTMAIHNAKEALKRRLICDATIQQRLQALADVLDLPQHISRIECFDVSHTSGQNTQAACVVFNEQGALKSDYRRYNIADVTPGDDYAAMRQALQRRYGKQQASEKIPDVLLIDGGIGQLHIALDVLRDYQLTGVIIVGVAKGEGRKPGLETLFIHDSNTPIHLSADSPALHLIQQIRDEAHRFAITGHRQRRKKAASESPLDLIPGIGAKRRKRLITRFGGWQGVKAASVNELMSVPGISQSLAELIYEMLRES